MQVINHITQSKDESKKKKKATHRTQVSKFSHLSETFLKEHTFFLGLTEKKTKPKKSRESRQGEKWF